MHGTEIPAKSLSALSLRTRRHRHPAQNGKKLLSKSSVVALALSWMCGLWLVWSGTIVHILDIVNCYQVFGYKYRYLYRSFRAQSFILPSSVFSSLLFFLSSPHLHGSSHVHIFECDLLPSLTSLNQSVQLKSTSVAARIHLPR